MNCVSWGLLLAPAVAGQTWSSPEVLPIEILHLFSLRCGAVWRCLVWLNAEHSVWDWRVPARFGLTRFSSVACRHRCRWTKQVLSVKNNLKRWLPSAFLLTSPLMWKSIYGYVFPLWRSVTYRPKMRSKQTRCSLVAVCEAPAQRAYCFLFLDLWGFLWISSDCLWIIWVPQPAGKRLSRVNMSSGSSSKQRRWLCVLSIQSVREMGAGIELLRLLQVGFTTCMHFGSC